MVAVPRAVIASDRSAAVVQKPEVALSASAAPAKILQMPDLTATVLSGRLNAIRLFVPTMAMPQQASALSNALSLLLAPKGSPATLGSLAEVLSSVTVAGGDSDALKTVLSRALFPPMRTVIDRAVNVLAEDFSAGGFDRLTSTEKRAVKQIIDSFSTPISSDKLDPSGEVIVGWFVYAHLDRQGRVRVSYDKKAKRGCFFELAVDSGVLGTILFGLSVVDGSVALDVWASPGAAETIRGEISSLVQSLRTRGISLRTWRVDSFAEDFCGIDTRV